MRSITKIVIHCSASPNGDSLYRGRQTPVQVIDGWHKSRGFKRAYGARVAWNPNLESIGYHYVVYANGAVATGRAPEEIGAHVSGHNAHSLGICMIGTDAYTVEQWGAAAALLQNLVKLYPDADVVGHRDLSPDLDGDGTVEPHEWLKTCPGFNVRDWLANGLNPLPGHLLEAR